jgi:hypothetical protein
MRGSSIMAKEKKQYEVVNEFRGLASQIIDKYPQQFYGIEIDKVQCVKITNKERPEKDNKLFSNIAVKMPIALDAPYLWYITVFGSDWDALSPKHKLLLVSEILCSIPTGDEEVGKVNGFDSKGYKLMQRTFKGIDYMDSPSVPNILEEDIQWVQGV